MKSLRASYISVPRTVFFWVEPLFSGFHQCLLCANPFYDLFERKDLHHEFIQLLPGSDLNVGRVMYIVVVTVVKKGSSALVTTRMKTSAHIFDEYKRSKALILWLLV